MSNKQIILSKYQYEIYAGSDWPSYYDYLLGKTDGAIALEIQKIEQDEIEHSKRSQIELARQTNNKLTLNFKSIGFYFLTTWFPALLGISLFFYTEGTLLKFIFLFLCFRVVNIFSIIGLHRWLCHYQFEPKKWARPFLLYMIVLGARSNPGTWIKAHWAHHEDQDTELDPYPPSWGLLNLCVFKAKFHKRYPFGRWMIANDIKFVLRHICCLFILNCVILAMIDLHILYVLLFMFLYDRTLMGLESYFYHDGNNTGAAHDGYKFLNYFIMIFMGTEWVHKSHHEKPWLLNFAFQRPDLIDFGYLLAKPLAKLKN